MEQWGEQRPQVLHLPADRVSSSGIEAIELGAVAGILFDPWQEFALDCMCAERADGRWAAFETGLCVSRQNGKGEIIMGRELLGLFVLHEPLIIHSAHQFSTADEAFLRIRDVVRNTPELSRKVKAMPEAHGEEGIELLPLPTIIAGSSSRSVRKSVAPRLRFLARTGGAGRGFTADTVVWDEAFNLPESVVNAQMPMLSAVPNPQLIYASSAVDQTIHSHGKVLAGVRARALAGNDPSLVWLEWQGDEREFYRLQRAGNRRALKAWLGQVQQWQAANPALGYRLTVEHTEKEWRGMSPRTFAVERLNIGDWPTVDDDVSIVDMERWAEIADPSSRPVGRIALAIDVSPDGKWSTIASAGRRDDGRWHVKIVDHREGTHWVVERVRDLVGAYDVAAVVLDPASPAGAFYAVLKSETATGARDGLADKRPDGTGVLVRTTAREMAQACGALLNDIDPDADQVRHCGQATLTDALPDADTRPLADAWAWSRKNSGGDISPVVAATLALHGMRAHGAERGIMPWGEYV